MSVKFLEKYLILTNYTDIIQIKVMAKILYIYQKPIKLIKKTKYILAYKNNFDSIFNMTNI